MVQVHHWRFDEEAQNAAKYIAYGDFADFSDTYGEESYSRLLIENVKMPNYISFDGKGIDLNDTHKRFYKSGDYVGYIAAESGGSLYILFSDYKDVGKGVTIAFYGNCCSEIEIAYPSPYQSYYQTVTVDNEFFHFTPDLPEVSNMSLYFKPALPNQLVKIAYIKFGDVTVYNKFKDINLLEEINVLSDDLPINTLDFNVVTETVDFKEDDELLVYSNYTYYGTFYCDDIERISKNIYSIKASDCIRSLNEAQYKEWDMDMYLDKFSSQIKDITNVTIEVPEERYSLGGNVPIDSCRYALCLCAFASCLMVDSSRSNKIVLKPIPTNISSIIKTSDKRILGECTYNKSAPITKVLIATPKGPGGGTNIETIKVINPANERVLYFWDEDELALPWIEQSEGITIYSSGSNYVEFMSTEENATLQVLKFFYAYTNITITNPLATGKKVNEKDFSKLNLRSQIILDSTNTGGVFSNTLPLLDNKKKDILKYIQSGGTIKGKIRLRGERVGDLIQIETAFDGMKKGIITSMNISFGYEDVADIEVLEWSL